MKLPSQDMNSSMYHQETMGFPDPLRTHDDSGLTAHSLVSHSTNNHCDSHASQYARSYGNHGEQQHMMCRANSNAVSETRHSNPSATHGSESGMGHNQNMGSVASRTLTSAISTRGGGPIGVLVMVYGTAEICERTQMCGLNYLPHSQIKQFFGSDAPPPSSVDHHKEMDRDGTLDISFNEWRDYLLFHPSANLQDIIQYWRHATNLDVGEDLAVPDDFSMEEWISGKWWRHLVAGGFAGMVSRTCTAPLDRLKVFLQVHGSKEFVNLSSCFKYMLKEGGVKGLWRGNGINVLKIAPEAALKFAAYEQGKRMMVTVGGGRERELTIYERFCAGSFAGGFSQTVIYPLEVLKTRLALRKTGQYKSIADAAKKIYKTEGLRSFYRGYIPNFIGIIPYAGIDLAIYETLKKAYIDHHSNSNPSMFVIVACGAFSSSCGQLASYPLALIRTRLQAQVLTPGVVQTQPVTMNGLFRHILAKEGLVGLYRGITPNFMKVAPAVSISYVVYEKCRQALGVTMT